MISSSPYPGTITLSGFRRLNETLNVDALAQTRFPESASGDMLDVGTGKTKRQGSGLLHFLV